MMEQMNNSTENESRVVFFELSDLAEGTIEAGEDQQERLEEFTNRVGSGEFHAPTEYTLPCGCIDGRCGCTMKPNSAGGTESLMVADDLTTKRYAGDGTTKSAYGAVVNMLRGKGEMVGGHDDEHADESKTGCGANDKLESIYAMIQKKAEHIRELTQAIGVTVSDEVHNQIVQNATGRTEFSAGNELLDILKAGGEDTMDHLRGEHNEVLVVINKQIGTTLDRDAVEAEFGPKYEAFNVDAWAFEEGARIISETEDEIAAKVAAITYYNIATALVLGGKKLRVTVLT